MPTDGVPDENILGTEEAKLAMEYVVSEFAGDAMPGIDDEDDDDDKPPEFGASGGGASSSSSSRAAPVSPTPPVHGHVPADGLGVGKVRSKPSIVLMVEGHGPISFYPRYGRFEVRCKGHDHGRGCERARDSLDTGQTVEAGSSKGRILGDLTAFLLYSSDEACTDKKSHMSCNPDAAADLAARHLIRALDEDTVVALEREERQLLDDESSEPDGM